MGSRRVAGAASLTSATDWIGVASSVSGAEALSTSASGAGTVSFASSFGVSLTPTC